MKGAQEVRGIKQHYLAASAPLLGQFQAQGAQQSPQHSSSYTDRNSNFMERQELSNDNSS